MTVLRFSEKMCPVGCLLLASALVRSCAERYSFGDFTLDLADRRLSRDGAPVPLSPMAFDVLVVLARNVGRLVHKRELLASVWPDTCVEPGILTVYISQLRSALDDTASPRKYIETVVRFGYRFVAPVVRHPSSRIAGPIHSKALEHVERGRLHLLNGSHFALEHAVDSFRAAVRANASDARAYAGLALARCTQAQHFADAPRRAYTDATHAALRALALDPSDATVQVALATLLFLMEWDWASAERAVQRALEIDAEHVDAYLLYGNLLETRAHLDDGLAMKMRALEHAPASPHVLTDIAVSFWRRRDYMNTITWSERALAHDSVHVRARMYLAFALWKLGRYDAVTNELLRQADAFGIARETLTHAAGASSQTAESARWPSPLARVVMARLPIAAGGPSVANAAIASGEQGHIDAAFRQLDVVIAQRQACAVSLNVDPQWDCLRRDPRFDHLLEYIGLA